MGGGKSRKTGGVSRALINRILNQQGKTSCGDSKGRKISVKDYQNPPRGLLDDSEEE